MLPGASADVPSAISCKKALERPSYARALYTDPAASLDDLCEAMTMLEDTERIARRVLGGTHPTATSIEGDLRDARAVLRARETPPPSA